MAANRSDQARTRRDATGTVAVWGVLGLVLAWCASSGAWRAQAAPTCEPIRYRFVGDSIPEFAAAELAVALQEIHERTGLVFEPQPDGTGPSKLSISWTTDGTRNSGLEVVGARGGTTGRRLGYGAALWRSVRNGRELVTGVIQVNGEVPWRRGLDVDDGLAAVFVHELGHVIGLPHGADEASFMHHETGGDRPVWSEAEMAALASFGQQSGCQPAGFGG